MTVACSRHRPREPSHGSRLLPFCGWAALTALMAAASLLLQYPLLAGAGGGGRNRRGDAAFLRLFHHSQQPGRLRRMWWVVLGRVLKPAVAASLAHRCDRVRLRACIVGVATDRLQWVDAGLHYVVPALSCWGGCCCCRTVSRAGARWAALLVPLAYLGWAMLVAAMTGQAPYPFLELQRLGLALSCSTCCALRACSWWAGPCCGAGPLAPSMRRCRASLPPGCGPCRHRCTAGSLARVSGRARPDRAGRPPARRVTSVARVQPSAAARAQALLSSLAALDHA